ncbi:hypothetical protein SLS64_013864 [Diaporthe eres]
MSQSREKDSKNDIVVAESGGDSPVGFKETSQVGSDGQAYTETKKTWKSFFWSSEHPKVTFQTHNDEILTDLALDVPKDEARFLTKLDLTLISSSALGVMCRYLDQVNITNAFNSGMKEDLALYGKELNYATAIWSAAYGNKVNAPLYIAFLEFAWTVFTFAHAGVKDVNQLYIFRFFVGLFEAGHFPAVMYVCSSYYKPHELARRNTLIQVFTSVGPLFSGFLMAAVHAGLNGSNGLAGWRWMYMSVLLIINTLSTFINESIEAKPNWIFSEEEIQLARSRMPTERKFLTGLFKWEDIKRWHTTWPVYLLIFWVKSYNVPGKAAVFSVAEINIIPLGMNAFAYIFTAWVPIFTFPANLQPYIVTGNYITAAFGAAAAITALVMRHFYNRDLRLQSRDTSKGV